MGTSATGATRRPKATAKKSLRFRSIKLENWRNFPQIQVPTTRRVFLIGPNAAGKSNLLDALRFLRDIARSGGGFQTAVERRGGVSRLRCLSARRYPAIGISVTVGSDEDPEEWVYELEFTQDNQRRPVLESERVIHRGSEVLSRPDKDDLEDRERLTQTSLEQVTANKDFRVVADFFESVRYLHIVPQLVREPSRSVGRVNDPYGGDFLEQLARARPATRDSRLRRISDALRVAVPQLEELKLHQRADGTWHIRGRYQHWRHRGAWQEEIDFSDGTLRLFGLLWAVLDGTGPLLLEEPELSLHAEVVNYLPQMFARLQRRSGRQIIVSTHSPELLRDEGIGLDEVLVLEPSSEGTRVMAAGELPDVATLIDDGSDLADVLIPRTRPLLAQQLAFFGD